MTDIAANPREQVSGIFYPHRLLTYLGNHPFPKIIGADVTGDVSAYHYESKFKRWLSASDGQEELPEAQVQIWQQQQNALNSRLVARINQGWRR